MQQKNLIQEYKDRLEIVLDRHFPKKRIIRQIKDAEAGKSTARGRALVMFAECIIIIQEVIRAFGSCTKCFGKGYGTQTLNYREFADFEGDKERIVKAPTIVYCDCERGRQLRKLLEREDEEQIQYD